MTKFTSLSTDTPAFTSSSVTKRFLSDLRNAGGRPRSGHGQAMELMAQHRLEVRNCRYWRGQGRAVPFQVKALVQFERHLRGNSEEVVHDDDAVHRPPGDFEFVEAYEGPASSEQREGWGQGDNGT